MSDGKSKILVLVEGAKTDVKLMQKLFEVYGISERYEILSYNTNIYTLYREMFSDGDPSSIDTLQNLKEHERDAEKKKLFDNRYSDILLIFDLDPQDPQFSGDKITEMAEYFTESSDMGKLYINYPMVEAFYHMKSIPDNDFGTYTSSMEELKSRQYKRRVNLENRDRDYGKFIKNRNECSTVIRQHVAKAWKIVGSSADEELPPDAQDILRTQLSLLSDLEKVYVLCTCCYYIAEYNPDWIKPE